MAGNTEILIKRSLANTAPSVLAQGELAFSYASNTLFIGTANGDSAMEVGHYSDLSNLTSGVYGDQTHIPVITVDEHGTVTNVSTSEISTTLSIESDNGSNTLSLITDTLFLTGGDGITTTTDGTEVIFDVDDTVLRSNTEGGPQYISSDVSISGNLTVQGTTTYVQSAINQTNDSLIELAANNTVGDVLDIGFYGKHEGVDGTVVTGLVRNAGTSDFYLFDNINLGDQENLTSNIITQASLSANGASLYSYQFLATQTEGSAGGYSFSGDEGGRDTGMFSPADGQLDFYSNAVKVISVYEGTGIVLENGANLGDHTNDSVYFGTNAGLTNQSQDAVAIGTSAGNLNQGYRSVAIGKGAGESNQGGWSTAVGLNAGNDTQGSSAVAIGHRAGGTTQGSHAVAVGVNSGQNSQGQAAVALGYRAGYGDLSSQGQNSIAIGTLAGYSSQEQNSIAINASGVELNPTQSGLYIDPIRSENVVGGNVIVYNAETKEVVYSNVKIDASGITLANGTLITDADSGFFVDSVNADATPGNVIFYNTSTGEFTYGSLMDLNPDSINANNHSWTVDPTSGALFSDHGTWIIDDAGSVGLGQNIDLTNSNPGRVAIGYGAANTSQSMDAVAIGTGAGADSQDISAVAIGNGAGSLNQSFSAVAVGRWAGDQSQGWDAVAVGRIAGRYSQGSYATAMGWHAGEDTQGSYSTAIGSGAGRYLQSGVAVAVGDNAGMDHQGWGGAAFGHHAGQNYQGAVAIAIGASSGQTYQGQAAIALGRFAGNYYQGTKAVAIGRQAGNYQQGQNAIAIGEYAGNSNQAAYSIVLNASGNTLNGDTAGLFIDPIAYEATQDATYDGLMFYNSYTKEVRYSYALDGGSF